MSAQLPYLPPILTGGVNDVANVAANTARDVQAQTTGAGKAGVIVRAGLPTFAAVVNMANDVTAAPVRAIVRRVAQPVQDFGRAVLGLPPATPATQAPVVPGSPDDTSQVLKVSTDSAGTTANGKKSTAAKDNAPAEAAATSVAPAAPAAPAGPAFTALPAFIPHSPALAIAEGYHQQAQYAAAQRDAILAAAERAAGTGNPNNASYRYAAALHALPALSGANNFGQLQAQGAVNLNDVMEKARSADITASTEAARTGVLAEANRLRAQEIRRNVLFQKIGEVPNPDPNTKMIKPFVDQYGYVTIGENGEREVYDIQGNRVNGPTPTASIAASASPSVGSKVKQADGEYSRGGKTYVVKNGVITEIR